MHNDDIKPDGEEQSVTDEVKENVANVGDEVGEGMSAAGDAIKDAGDSLQSESEEEIREHGDIEDQDKQL